MPIPAPTPAVDHLEMLKYAEQKAKAFRTWVDQHPGMDKWSGMLDLAVCVEHLCAAVRQQQGVKP